MDTMPRIPITSLDRYERQLRNSARPPRLLQVVLSVFGLAVLGAIALVLWRLGARILG